MISIHKHKVMIIIDSIQIIMILDGLTLIRNLGIFTRDKWKSKYKKILEAKWSMKCGDNRNRYILRMKIIIEI